MTETRTYRARNRAAAYLAYNLDAEEMSRHGWLPQIGAGDDTTWASASGDRRWTSDKWEIRLSPTIVLRLPLSKASGTLTVTYVNTKG